MSESRSRERASDRTAIGRLNCPSCGAGFAAPKDLDKAKGRRARCQVCAFPFRFSADGLSLIALEASSSGSSGSSEHATRALSQPEPKSAKPRGDSIEDIELDQNRPLPNETAAKSFPLPWAIAAVASVALLVTLGITLSSAAKQGTIKIDLESTVSDVTISIDGKPIGAEQLKAPLALPVGPHRLEVAAKGMQTFQGSLPVFEGTNPSYQVKLTAVPKPVQKPEPEPKQEPLVVAAASTDATEAVTPTEPPGAAENPVPAETKPGDPAAPAEVAMEDPEKTATDPPGKPKSDLPDIPEINFDDDADAKNKVKADTTLKQIVGDPESYIDASVVPSDLLRINTVVVPKRGPNKGLTVTGHDGAYQKLVKPGTTFEIVVPPAIAAGLADQVKDGNLVKGNYPAILKFKVTKDPANSSGYLGVVEGVEFLVYVDPRVISKGKALYNKAFTAINISEGGVKRGITPSYKVWQKKLVKTGMINKLKIAYNQAFEINRGQQYDQWAEMVKNKLPANAKVLHQNLMSLFQ